MRFFVIIIFLFGIKCKGQVDAVPGLKDCSQGWAIFFGENHDYRELEDFHKDFIELNKEEKLLILLERPFLQNYLFDNYFYKNDSASIFEFYKKTSFSDSVFLYFKKTLIFLKELTRQNKNIVIKCIDKEVNDSLTMDLVDRISGSDFTKNVSKPVTIFDSAFAFKNLPGNKKKSAARMAAYINTNADVLTKNYGEKTYNLLKYAFNSLNVPLAFPNPFFAPRDSLMADNIYKLAKQYPGYNIIAQFGLQHILNYSTKPYTAYSLYKKLDAEKGNCIKNVFYYCRSDEFLTPYVAMDERKFLNRMPAKTFIKNSDYKELSSMSKYYDYTVIFDSVKKIGK